MAEEEAAFQGKPSEPYKLLNPPPPPEPGSARHNDWLRSLTSEIRQLLEEYTLRRIEALNIYEPLPLVDKFHACKAPERLLRGSNRAGKTLGLCCEIARAACGKDPYKKYPIIDGRCFVIGKDGKHISEVLYRKLFRPGAFRVIKDKSTMEWRTWKPWEPEDLANKHLSKPAPPLIPERMVADIAWENKKARQPQIVRLYNGWEINFFSSLGSPPQGSDIDLACLDEEIIDPHWVPEMAARLVDRKGRFIWSATPQAGTDQLLDLSDQAAKEVDRKDPRIVEFVTLLLDNPHIPEDQRMLLEAKYGDPNNPEYRVRILGEFAQMMRLIYPEFCAIHTIEMPQVPNHYTRYAAIDPGRRMCGVIFCAVPPPPDKHKLIYDELYIENCTAIRFGLEMGKKCSGQQFQAFIIDSRMGRQTEIGIGQTIERQYSEQLKANGISSISTGHGFIWGSDDPKAGIEKFRSWLYIGGDGEPIVKLDINKTKKLQHELRRYHNKMVKGELQDEPARKRAEGPDGCRYLAMHGCPYIPPIGSPKHTSYAVQAVKDKAERQRQKEGKSYVNLAPGA